MRRRECQEDVEGMIRIKMSCQSQFAVGIARLVFTVNLEQDGRHRLQILLAQSHGLVGVRRAGHFLVLLFECSCDVTVPVRVGGARINDDTAAVQHLLRDFQFADAFRGIVQCRLGRLSSLAIAHVHVANFDAEEAGASTVGIYGVHHVVVMQPWIDAAHRHGTSLRSLAIGSRLARKAQRELAVGAHHAGLEHLVPVGSLVVGHAHDPVRQLRFEESGDSRLAAEDHLEREMAGVLGIDAVRARILDERHDVRAAHVAQVRPFEGIPPAPFGVRHADVALVAAVAVRPGAGAALLLA
mmetsp:Transcript_5280/g.15465  ORF Transcript_5280/g.15465 Transcript_5280/m.15465 type:complete len:298 (+) Transcript_5280:2236-3129(+)